MSAKNPRRSGSYVPPPMGPVIWYRYKCRHNSEEINCINRNKGLIADWIFVTRYEQLKTSNDPLSEMELKELIALGKELRTLYDRENLQIVEDILTEYKGWLKKPPRELVKDRMSQDIELSDKHHPLVISKDRHKLRHALCLTYNALMHELIMIKLETRKLLPRLIWKKAELDRHHKAAKRFIERIIQEKLFTREDIYGKIFEDDTIFDQINKAFKAYATKWKKHYGADP